MPSLLDSLPPALLNGPIRSPPPGFHYDPDDPGLTNAWIATLVVCLSSSTILLLIRLYTRFYVIKKHGAEDYLTVFGWAMTFGFCGITVVLHEHGVGKHLWNVPFRDLSPLLKYISICEPVILAALLLLKVAIVTQFRATFRPQSRRSFMWWSTWAMTIILSTFYITTIILSQYSCFPVTKLLHPTGHGSCLDIFALLIGVGYFNIFSDAIILLIPQYSIWKLNLPFQKRLGLAAVFLLGTLALAFSCVRHYYTYPLKTSLDTTYDFEKFGLWMIGELSLGIVCICLPVCPRFLKSVTGETRFYSEVASNVHKVLSSVSTQSARRASVSNRTVGRSELSKGSRVVEVPESQNRSESEDKYLGRFRPDVEHGLPRTGIVRTDTINVETHEQDNTPQNLPRMDGW